MNLTVITEVIKIKNKKIKKNKKAKLEKRRIMKSLLHKLILGLVEAFFEEILPFLLPYIAYEVLLVISFCIECYIIVDMVKSLNKCKYVIPRLVGYYFLIFFCVPTDWLKQNKFST
jgi:hypothetical protein